MKFVLFLSLLLPVAAQASLESDFLAAREALRVGDAAKLDGVAQNLKETVLEPYLTYYQLKMNWNMRNTEPIHAFLRRTKESPVVNQFRAEWLKYLGKQRRWAEFAADYPESVNRDAELECYQLQYRQQTEQENALRDSRRFWLSGEGQPESCATVFADALQAGLISEEDVWLRMRMALENGNVTLAKQLIQQLPKDQRFSAAELTMATRNPKQYLQRTKFENAGRGRRLAALFALLRLSKTSPTQAFARWEATSAYFSEADQRYFFGWLAFEGARAHEPQALAWYAAAGDANLNEEQLAWRVRAALRAEAWHEVWASIMAMTPEQQGDGAWRYWKGRALKEMGRGGEAAAIFIDLSKEYNFYGQLAAEELGSAPGAGVVSSSYQPTESELQTIENLPAVQRTMLLYGMDMRVEAAREWSWALRNFSDRQLLVAAEVARRNEMYDRSIMAADRTVTMHDFNLRYPAPYREALQEDVSKHDLEEAWVYGLMRQESRFAVMAKSHVGAAGLMQIMPQTARWVARRMGMKGYRKGLIHQLDVNIKLGTYYMKTVSNQFDDNPVLASAAYNAGPSRATLWRGEKPLEGAIYTETIPFDETRDYVKKVMSNTAYYAKLFGTASRTLKQRLGVIAPKVENRKSRQR